MPEITARLSTALADRYRIEGRLGEGGMATVYLAEDLKHDRKVALKVLKPELAAILGADRFLSEIKVTANLQHPNILPLYDSGEADSFLYYVMPFVEGDTLRDKLERERQLSVEETVEIAKSVSAALGYAHEQGIIHRDIKPENILLQRGQALVADFGIALAVNQAGGTRLTETGLSLGTPQYMSPEQAMGDRELDARSDIYSLGVITYEMLVGDPPHLGGNAQAVIAKILSDRPSPITQTRDLVPLNVDAAVQKALAKSPADRFTSAVRYVEALTNPSFTIPTSTGGVSSAIPSHDWRQRVAVPLLITAILMTGLFIWSLARPGTPPQVTRYGLNFAQGQELIDDVEVSFTFSPDGSRFVYVGPGDEGRQLWVKRRDQFDASPLPATAGALHPAASPDGQWVAYTVGREVWKIPMAGGSSVHLADSADVQYGGVSWLENDTLVYVGSGHHLRMVPADGGASNRVWTPPAQRFAVLPVALPGAEAVLFTLCDNECNTFQELWVLDLRTGEARSLIPEVAQAWHVPTGHLVYVRPDGGVFAVPFDLDRFQVHGAAIPLMDSVKVDAGIMPDFTLASSGIIARIRGHTAETDFELVWVDRDGTVQPIDPTWTIKSGPAEHGWALSPDDARLAIRITRGTEDDIWVKQLDGGLLSRITFHAAQDLRPRWMPDGQSLSFISIRAGAWDLYTKRADGTGSAELLVDLDTDVWEGLALPDGSFILRVGGEDRSRDLIVFRSGVTSKIAVSPYDEKAFALSPDGRWLAYQSDETGQSEIYVRPFPYVETGKWQVSTEGGMMPKWGRSGPELFYVSHDREMVAASIVTDPSFAVASQTILFALSPGILAPLTEHYTVYDVSRDDRRFVMARRVGFEDRAQGSLVIVENWFEELKAKVGNE